MSEQVKVGVIGVGNMGRHHIRNYSEIPSTELVAVADPNEQIAELAEQYKVHYYTDYVEMLDTHQLDAVSVAVPTPLHHQITKDTLSRGISTLVEKPIASTITEGQELIDLAEDMKVVFGVGHVERYNPVVERLKQMIDSGSLGKVLSIEARRVGGFPAIEPKTDVIMDLAIHDIDIINYLMSSKGKVREVNGHRSNHSHEFDSTEMFLDYDGVSGIIIANWVTPVKIREIIITGSKGYLQANYINQEIAWYEKTNITQKNSFKGFIEAFGEPKKHLIQLSKKEPLRRQLSAFVLAVAKDNRQELISPHEALSALDIAIAAITHLKEKKHLND